MKTKTILLVASTLISFSASANEANELRRYELKLTPQGIGYSNYSGLIVAGDLSLGVRLSEHFQWEFGAGTWLTSKRTDRYKLYSGLRYNFSEDLARSWWVTLGAEYGTDFKCCEDKPAWNARLEVGKRFKMNQSGTWTYAPHVRATTDGDRTRLSINPASFTYSF